MQDNFESGNYILTDGQTSPNGLWKCQYAGYGQTGVRAITAPGNGRSGNVQFLNPQVNLNGTSAALVLTTESFGNFGGTFYMRTVSQHHAGTNIPAENWETAWLMFRYVDNTHHYYFYIQRNGTIEIGGKDYIKVGNDRIQTPDGVIHNVGVGNQDRQFFLDTSTNVGDSNILGKWYKIRLEIIGNKIKWWVNDVFKKEIFDNGSTGTWLNQPKTFTPSSQMSNGKFGKYCEDALCEFDNDITAPK